MVAKQQMKLAFSLASFADCGGDEKLSPQGATEEGTKNVDSAIAIFKKVCEWISFCIKTSILKSPEFKV